jgi:uncharacterized protein (DUF1501 family)
VSKISRREMLTWFAVAPVLPRFIVNSAEAAALQTTSAYDGPVVIVVRFMGGNDGLNAVVPVNDDRYYRARPTIAIPKNQTIAMPGGEIGLNPWLTDYKRLMDDGCAAIVQGIGYPNSSRSHLRGTEIFECGAVTEPAPQQGWLGRYVDNYSDPMTGVQFADQLGKTLSSGRAKSIGNPNLLLEMNADKFESKAARTASARKLDFLLQVENDLGDAARQLRKATRGSGSKYEYPNTEFGQSLRWTADMIETGCPTRVYYLTLGSFATLTSPSFDTHSREIEVHKSLYSEFGRSLRIFTDHMKKAGQFNRVLLLTFSEFGRLLEENRSNGTDHGEASMMFVAGGKVRPGLLGKPLDLGKLNNGGPAPNVDFRQVYANVLRDWLKVDPVKILGEKTEPFQVLA